MNLLARNKITASLLVVGGFVAWLFIGPIFGDRWMGYGIGCAAFFIVGCFLPETRPITFLSRRSSLGLAGLFAWMVGNQILRDRPIDSTVIENPMIRSTLDVGIPILLGVVAYWLSIFLIRGFRATPEYDMKKGEQDAPSNPYQPPCCDDLSNYNINPVSDTRPC